MRILSIKRLLFFFGILCVVCLLINGFSSCAKKIKDVTVQRTTTIPSISGFTPVSDSIGGLVTIEGENFSADTSRDIIKFGGTRAIITSATTAKIIAKVPAGAVPGKISVTVDGNTAVSANDFTVNVLPVPIIISFTPESDTIGGLITLSGANFDGIPANNIVKFNGVPALVTFATISQLKAIVPANATNGKVSVTVGSFTGTSMDNFSLLPPVINGFSPASDTVGAVVTISGSNFSSNMANDTVKFNGQLAVIVSATPTQIITLVPDYAIVGNITVSVGTQVTTSPGIFTIYGVSTLAGINQDYYGDGAGKQAYFSVPKGLATDVNGNIYVTDFQNQRIRKVTPGGVTTTIAGNGMNGSQDGVGSNASFNEPLDVAVDGNGVIYVADNASNKIRKITTDGTVTTFANISEPISLGVDQNGNVFVGCSQYGGAVYKFTRDGTKSIIAGDTMERAHVDGQGSAARFAGPAVLTVDANGNVYVADGDNSIRKISSTGEVTTVAGQPGIEGTQDGSLSSATFYHPYNIAVDGHGNLFLTELNHIRKIDLSAGIVSTYAGTMSPGPLSLNGSFLNATFEQPNGICVDQSGIVYVSSFDEIRRISVH